MSWFLILLVLIHDGESSTDLCPTSCSCSAIETHGLIVNCNSRHLKTVPDLPITTVKLYLQNNLMTTVPPGALDHLVSLQEVDISGNPWNCDCNILYLKAWLDSQPVQRNHANVQCATPQSASMKAFQNLTGNEMPRCGKPWPIKCKRFFVRDLYMNALAVVVLIFMSYIARMARKLSCRVAVSPRSLQNTSTKETSKSK
ncbi:PREDICTED: platelet glycoprotein IX-like [Nanorana parkeri]|uniref:platelet glycoprotein IX-like n=1 Tax=Nanorana parkeri TaxID=125878 RepID=UPI000854B2F1|nr:PREDICTED: platelet glycoprotein IX-like [Nanorana parkeri]